MIKAKLVVVGGDAKAREVDLTLPTVIGRSRDVTLTLPHPLVSRRHTELFEQDGYLYVKDLDSLNGTYVNNRRIDSAQRLKPNELLTLGNVTFRALYDAEIVEADLIDDLPLDAESRISGDTENVVDEKDETVSWGRTDKRHQGGSVKPSRSNGVVRCNESSQRQSLESVVGQSLSVSNVDVDAGESSVSVSASGSISAVTSGLAASSTSGLSGLNLSGDSPVRAINDDVGVNVNQAHHSVVAQEQTPSNIFSDGDGFITSEKSISVSALESLPPLNPAVSVLGGELNLGDRPQPSPVEAIDLDIDGSHGASDSGKSDVALGSFLKKLPR